MHVTHRTVSANLDCGMKDDEFLLVEDFLRLLRLEVVVEDY